MAKPRLGSKKVLAGVLLITIGIIYSLIWPTIVDYILRKQLQVRPDSETYKLWKDPPVPIYIDFYFFNWTNPEEVKTEKPRLQEIGPYRFHELNEKTRIVWNDNGTVTYRRKRIWRFDEENSIGSLDDQVTTLNPIALSAANTVRSWNYLLQRSLSMTISSNKQEVYVTESVGDLLFNGYTDPLLSFARNLPAFAGLEIPYDKFGWFYLRNGSDSFEGVYNMDTGVNDVSKFGVLHQWNYSNKTEFYPESCGEVRGSAGEFFPPGLTPRHKVQLYSADLCRSVSLDYSGEIEAEGVSGFRYSGGPRLFDNGTLEPSNRCFCGDECVPSGVLNVTTCRLGAPGFISYPHFLHADPFYLDQVEGMAPDPEKHSLYIVLEPTTGIPLDVAGRFQINLLLSPVPAITLYQNVPRIFFPMIWFEQRASITSELAIMLKLALALPHIGQGISIILVFLGIAILISHYYSFCHFRKRIPVKIYEEVKLTEATARPLITENITKTINSEAEQGSQFLKTV